MCSKIREGLLRSISKPIIRKTWRISFGNLSGRQMNSGNLAVWQRVSQTRHTWVCRMTSFTDNKLVATWSVFVFQLLENSKPIPPTYRRGIQNDWTEPAKKPSKHQLLALQGVELQCSPFSQWEYIQTKLSSPRFDTIWHASFSIVRDVGPAATKQEQSNTMPHRRENSILKAHACTALLSSRGSPEGDTGDSALGPQCQIIREVKTLPQGYKFQGSFLHSQCPGFKLDNASSS